MTYDVADLAQTPRYHYAGSAAVAALLGILLARPFGRASPRRRRLHRVDRTGPAALLASPTRHRHPPGLAPRPGGGGGAPRACRRRRHTRLAAGSGQHAGLPGPHGDLRPHAHSRRGRVHGPGASCARPRGPGRPLRRARRCGSGGVPRPHQPTSLHTPRRTAGDRRVASLTGPGHSRASSRWPAPSSATSAD